MPIGSKGISKAKFGEALREELFSSHNTRLLDWQYLGRGLIPAADILKYTLTSVPYSQPVFVPATGLVFQTPGSKLIRSNFEVLYGAVDFQLILPTMGAGVVCEFGFGMHYNNAYFTLNGAVLQAFTMNLGNNHTENLTAYLPANYNTAYHQYLVKHFSNRVEFYIDRVLVYTEYGVVPDQAMPFVLDNVSTVASTMTCHYIVCDVTQAVGIERRANIVNPVQPVNSIRSDKDTHFTGAIAQNAKRDENLTGLVCNKVRVTNVMIQAKENLQFRLLFWKNDAFDDTDLDVDGFIGFVDLDIPSSGFQIGAANQYYLNVNAPSTQGLLDYIDSDGTRELHVSLQCVSAAGKTAGVAGQVVVEVYYVRAD